ncbi:hypothetical protein Dsin_023498 [Dipteronia sinensis]|uniref:Pectinesterase inhibitor domain-containing protein n=1 Tax=Dipteronia sinensis TaxID=43782 RepID=A0AAE0A3E0_9ROSI|nr:hypothetical protein Dsin_023498 [Dipteronia sinensis]
MGVGMAIPTCIVSWSMVHLGWIAGPLCMIVFAAVTIFLQTFYVIYTDFLILNLDPPESGHSSCDSVRFTVLRAYNNKYLRAPGAANAYLTTLASFSLKSTYAALVATDAFLVALLPNVTDPRVKQVVTHCRTDYDGSIPPLQTAITSLDEGHFDDVSLNVDQALENINDCDRVIKVGPPPPGLPEKSTHVVRLVDISGVISIMLLHSYSCLGFN